MWKLVSSRSARRSKAPNAIGSVNPTSRSVTAKLIRKKEVRLSLLRSYKNTNMVKMLATIMITDSNIAASKSAIIIAAVYMIAPLNWPTT